jgi:hypothetical protein
VKDYDSALYERQRSCQRCVKQGCYDDHEVEDHGPVPSLKLVVCIVQREKALDLALLDPSSTQCKDRLTTVAARKAHEAVVACQASILMYPARKLNMFLAFPGVRRATKWYWPPVVYVRFRLDTCEASASIDQVYKKLTTESIWKLTTPRRQRVQIAICLSTTCPAVGYILASSPRE